MDKYAPILIPTLNRYKRKKIVNKQLVYVITKNRVKWIKECYDIEEIKRNLKSCK